MANNYGSKTDLELMVGKDEKILWSGKPNKRCYVLEGIFNPMLPFALLWFLFDSLFIVAALSTIKADISTAIGLLLFFSFHLMPVWMYLGGVLLIERKYQHTQYIVTDKAVYISGGLFSYSCQMKPFCELSRVNIRRGIIDQMLGVGDVALSSNESVYTNNRGGKFSGIAIEDIYSYNKVFSLIKELQTDIYTDTMYPNDLRPKENHGYKTEYQGRGLDIQKDL